MSLEGSLRAKILSISVFGDVHVKFSEVVMFNNSESALDPPFNLSLINTTNTQLYVNVTKVRLSDNSFNATNLNFTWNVSHFYDDIMIFKIVFDNPLLISPKIIQDELVVNFFDSYTMLSNRPSV